MGGGGWEVVGGGEDSVLSLGCLNLPLGWRFTILGGGGEERVLTSLSTSLSLSLSLLLNPPSLILPPPSLLFPSHPCWNSLQKSPHKCCVRPSGPQWAIHIHVRKTIVLSRIVIIAQSELFSTGDQRPIHTSRHFRYYIWCVEGDVR